MTWKPIYTIPQDGKQYLVVRRLRSAPWVSMSVAAWMSAEGEWLANLTWFDEESFLETWTHWQELPSPPEGTK